MGPHFPIFSFFYLYIIIVNKESAISFSNSFSRADSEFENKICMPLHDYRKSMRWGGKENIMNETTKDILTVAACMAGGAALFIGGKFVYDKFLSKDDDDSSDEINAPIEMGVTPIFE